MSRVLVLGGTVFVGRHLVRALVDAGHDVTVLNRGRTPGPLPPGVGRVIADRTDVTQVAAVAGGRDWDAVYDVSGFVMAAGGVDVEGLLDVFDGRTGCYLYVSSIMAYDQALLGVVPWTEDMATNRSGPGTYGGFKAVVEAALLARWAERRFPAVIVRPAAIYGPDNNIYDMELPMWLRLRQHRPILLPHSGLVTASYGHVDDLCRAMLGATAVEAALGEVFNLTTSAVTTRRYVEELAEVVGVEPDIVALPDEALAGLAKAPFGHLFGRAHHAVLDTAKARTVLGFRPEHDFAGGHRHTYDWWLSEGPKIEGPLQDPMWRATWDFDLEAEVAAAVVAAAAPPAADPAA